VDEIKAPAKAPEEEKERDAEPQDQHFPAVAESGVLAPAVQSVVVASQPISSQVVAPRVPTAPFCASLGSFIVVEQPAESPPLASQSAASQPVASQLVERTASQPPASDLTTSQPAVLQPTLTSPSVDGDGAIAPDALLPEAFLGRWVRDGGKTHIVVSVPGPAGSFLDFRPTDSQYVSSVPAGVPILHQNGEWNLSGFRLTAAFRGAMDSGAEAGPGVGTASVLKWEDASGGLTRRWRRPKETIAQQGTGTGCTHATQG
jgi:hypothetical protein